MNPTIEAFARAAILEELAKLPEKAQLVFRKLYAEGDTMDVRLATPLNVVVAKMSAEKLDRALTQAQRTERP